MARIKVDIKGLQNNKAEIQKQINELEHLNAKLDSLISNIESTWDGAASEMYVERMRSHRMKAVQMESVLREFQGYIGEAAARVSAKDKEGASRIRGC